MKKLMVSVVVLLAAAANAGGLMVSASELDERSAQLIASEVSRAKERSPDVFTKVERLAADMPRLDAMKRGRVAPISPMLKALGPDAAWAALATLALEAPVGPELAPSAAYAYRLGLIETIGMARLDAALPVLAVIVEKQELDTGLVRASAEAIARLGSDAAVELLVRRAAAETKERQLAVLSGMGDSRRLKATDVIASALASERDEARAAALIKALTNAGNAWAWRTSGARFKAEEQSVKSVAATALVQALVRFEQQAADAAADGLLVIDAPSTVSLIADAKAASPQAGRRLDALSARFARNPARL